MHYYLYHYNRTPPVLSLTYLSFSSGVFREVFRDLWLSKQQWIFKLMPDLELVTSFDAECFPTNIPRILQELGTILLGLVLLIGWVVFVIQMVLVQLYFLLAYWFLLFGNSLMLLVWIILMVALPFFLLLASHKQEKVKRNSKVSSYFAQLLNVLDDMHPSLLNSLDVHELIRRARERTFRERLVLLPWSRQTGLPLHMYSVMM